MHVGSHPTSCMFTFDCEGEWDVLANEFVTEAPKGKYFINYDS